MSSTLTPIQDVLRKKYNEFIWDRVDNVGVTIQQTTSSDCEYQKHSAQYNELFHTIRQLLGEDRGRIMFELDQVACAIHAFDVAAFYEQGLKDGLSLRSAARPNEFNTELSILVQRTE